MWYKYEKLHNEIVIKTIYFRARSIKLVNWYLNKDKDEIIDKTVYTEHITKLKEHDEEINNIDLYIAILRPNNYKIIEIEKKLGYYFNHQTAQYYKQIIL